MSPVSMNLELMIIFILCDVRDIYICEMWSYRKVKAGECQVHESTKCLQVGNPQMAHRGKAGYLEALYTAN